MVAKAPDKELERLPRCAVDFIKLVIRKMRYRQTARAEVTAELTAHFEDELKDCKSDEERQQKAEKLIAEFGDVKLLGILLRRAKKRCRPLWRTMVARTFQAIGILTLFFSVYVGWFLTGRPIISVDYLAQVNQIVRPVADESLNAAPLYDKAVELYEKVSDEFLLFFAENHEAISDADFPGWHKKIAEGIAKLFSDDKPANLSEERDSIQEKVKNRLSLLLSKCYLEMSTVEREFIKRYIAEQEKAFDLVAAGVRKPYYWQRYATLEDTEDTTAVWAIVCPQVPKYRQLCLALFWRARLSAEQGRYEDAFEDLKSCYRLGQQFRGHNAVSIQQLVGVAIEALAIHRVRDILSEYEIDSTVLTKLQKDFEHMVAEEDFTISFEWEKLLMYDTIQRCFTGDGIGGGHLYVKNLLRLAREIRAHPLEEFTEKGNRTALLHVLLTHPDKEETKRITDRYFAFLKEAARKSPAALQREGIDIEQELGEIIKGNRFLEMLAPPALSRIIGMGYQIRAEAQALVTITGVLRFKHDKGSYPESLKELQSRGYISKLPMDPWSDEPLVYKKTDDDFTLYSVAENFKDDGGEVIRDYDGRVGMWVGEGDAVFWPVPEPETPEERNERVEKEWEERHSIRYFGPCPHSEHRRPEIDD